MSELYAGIEAGGTKFVCALGSGPDDIRDQRTFPTTSPEETLQQTLGFLGEGIQHHGELAGIGIASFGPLDPEPGSPTYGYITATPKPGWSNFDFVGAIQDRFDLPIGFDTDVNGAALGEWRWGAARGLDTFIYLTIGTGIGGGGLVNGKLMHGLIHPEMGHIRIPHNWEQDPFPGSCPFHGDCLEGLANGPAMGKRWGQRAETSNTRPPCLGAGSRIHRQWTGQLHLHLIATTHHTGWWGNGAVTAFPPGARTRAKAAEWLCPVRANP